MHELLRLRSLLFIVAAAVSTSLAALAADGKAEKIFRIAYVLPDSDGGSARTTKAFRERLRDLGWVEGKNFVLDQYWAAGHLDRFPDLIRQALAQSPDILVTGSTPGALAAKKATTTVPIVVAAMGDPVQSGVVANLAKPGGNLTALSTGYIDGFAGKWLELLLEVVPHATSIAVLWNTDNPVVLPYRADLEEVARAHGVKLNFIDVHQVQRLDSAFRDARRTAQAAVVVCENLFIQNVPRVVDLAAAARLPSVYCLSSFPKAGGLISYGVDLPAMFRRAAEQVDKILRGAKVGDLPVEQPNNYELVVNLRTAKALGITIPEAILSRADELIR
jgi:ABC-type uncharacterized transport system substrate-binding protein